MVTEIEGRPVLDDAAAMNKFENFAQRCPYRVGDTCNLHNSSPGTCAQEFCVLFGKARIDETRGDGHGRSP